MIFLDEDFNYRWKEGTIRGWEKKEESKEDVHNNPLYCNACVKLFSNENTYVVKRNTLIFFFKYLLFNRIIFPGKNTKQTKKFTRNNFRIRIKRMKQL